MPAVPTWERPSVPLAREVENLPEFRRVFTTTAFAEGWALYAESLGSELGTVYRDAPSRFGQLARRVWDPLLAAERVSEQ